VYVSDGYGSARVVKFSRNGRFLLQWGKRGTGPGEFGLPHNLVVDSQGLVYVTDRDNERVQVFDPLGKFRAEWKNIGAVSALALTPDGRIWTGAVLRDLNGNAIGRLPEGTGAHGATVDAEGNVYLAQLSGIVQKFSNERR
jgi:DNA-binding beta-propeller fold protein YncE